MTQFAVVAERYARAIEAEVARAQLESAGIDCVVEEAPGAAEVRVRPEELGAARSILHPHLAFSGEVTTSCPSCGGRTIKGQGRVFWSALTAAVLTLLALAWLVSYTSLIALALVATGVLVGLELALKDWLCRRCGQRWRG
jgi:hypothetical protein